MKVRFRRPFRARGIRYGRGEQIVPDDLVLPNDAEVLVDEKKNEWKPYHDLVAKNRKEFNEAKQEAAEKGEPFEPKEPKAAKVKEPEEPPVEEVAKAKLTETEGGHGPGQRKQPVEL